MTATITTEQTETGVNVTLHGQEGVDRFVAQAEAMVRPPHEARFGDSDFLPGREIERIAQRLISQHQQRFGHLKEFEVVYLWKAKGGGSGGRLTLGKCVKASGLARHFSNADFVIWLAADNVAAYRLTPRQIEALVFRQLLKAGVSVDKDDNVKPVLLGYDYEGFAEELRVYGFWSDELGRMADTVRQLTLPEVDKA